MRSKKALRNIITTLLYQIVAIIYGFVIPKIIISKFGSEVNGLVSSVTTFLSYITLFEAGFGGVVQFILYKPIAKKNNKEIEDILNSALCFFKKISYLFLTYVVLLSIFYPLFINSELDYLFISLLILIVSISTFVEYYYSLIYNIILLAKQENYIINSINIVIYSLNIILFLILSQFNISIHELKLFTCLIFLIKPVVESIYVKKKYNIYIKNGRKDYVIKQKWDALSQHIASVIHNNTDIIVLSLFSSLAIVSVYSIYNMILMGVKKILGSLTDSINSLFGDMIVKNEEQNLRKKFNMFESAYIMIVVIVFACTFKLISPFVSIYSKNFVDFNYVRPTFGYIIVLAEFVFCLRVPYNKLILAAGHYKETQIGAWIETSINIIISIALVIKFGLYGVAIGTLCAMTYRMIAFIYHSNKYILKRKVSSSFFKICFALITFAIIEISFYFISSNMVYMNYIDFLKNGFILFGVSSIVSIILFYTFYNSDIIEVINLFKSSILKRGSGK